MRCVFDVMVSDSSMNKPKKVVLAILNVFITNSFDCMILYVSEFVYQYLRTKEFSL